MPLLRCSASNGDECLLRVPSGEKRKKAEQSGRSTGSLWTRVDWTSCGAGQQRAKRAESRAGPVRSVGGVRRFVDQENNDHYKKHALFAGWRPLSRRPVYTGLIGCAKIDQR
ncbi:hypothetical protein T11_6877 [Trichinella zimbabwensis]|uniref:Uncharacterized protein n=1 Tax=Trichinella zimbabwensis TaxID=268475 RepID=A0A0V1HR05_9BILA|nr:hypothetical protein T11_6877 [Trichinella zimbabwensis]